MVYAMIYSTSTGEIDRSIDCPSEVIDLQPGEGEDFLLVSRGNDETHLNYVDVSADPPTLKARAALDTVHTVDDLTITFHALPAGLTLRVDGAEMLTDGDDAVEFELPGTYAIELFGSAPHLDEILEVTVG